MKFSRNKNVTRRPLRALLAVLALSALALGPFSLALAESPGCGAGFASASACATCPNCQPVDEAESSVHAASCCTVDSRQEPAVASSGCCARDAATGERVTGHQCPCSLSVPGHPMKPVRHSFDQAANGKPTHTQLELLADLKPLQDLCTLGAFAFVVSGPMPSAPKLSSLCCYRC